MAKRKSSDGWLPGDPDQLKAEMLGRLTTIITADSVVDGVSEVAVAASRPAQFLSDRIEDDPRTITGNTLQANFEQLIDLYAQRGYGLHSWSLAAAFVPGYGIRESIVAVFELKAE